MKRTGKTILHIILLIGLGILVYLPALDASFHLDDSPSIRDNQAIRSLSPGMIFKFWPTRFITYYSLALNFSFSGLSPGSYHLTNIVIHIINALLVYWLLLIIMPAREHSQSRAEVRGSIRGFIPLAGALLFLLHPLQTQAVTYVVQRATSLGTCFYLLSVVLYCRGRKLATGTIWRFLSFQGALAASAAAMLTKEFTFSLPFILLLIEILNRPPGRFPWKRLAPFFIALLIIPTLVGLNRGNPYYNDSRDISRIRYFSTQERVFLTYLRLVILPFDQRVEYDHPWQATPLAVPAAAGAVVWIAWVVTACRVRRFSFPGALGLLWFALTLLPESSFKPITDTAVEHRLYLPMAGISIALGTWLSKWQPGKFRRLMLCLCLVLLGFLTYRRNQVWKNPITLWEDNVVKAEGKARVHGNLGKAYLDAGRYGRASEEFERMIELDPTFAGAYNNLAVIYIDHKRDDAKARHYILKSLELVPDYPSGYLNLGVIEMNNFRWLPAIRNFEKTLELDPSNQTAHYNIAASYFNLGNRLRKDAGSFDDNQDKEERKRTEAVGAFEMAVEYTLEGMRIWPADPRFYQLMGLIMRVQNREKEAKDYFQKARLLKSRQTALP